MENNIVKEFQKLRMFANCSFLKMDELVQDLTNALEESSKSQRGNSSDSITTGIMYRHNKKRRGKKRRSNPTLLWEYGQFSEVSQSSVDEMALKDYIENVSRQSDSDDLVITRQIAQITFPLTSSHIPPVESDSVTENFSPIRAERRRRKFTCKSMAIDTETDTNGAMTEYIKPRQKRIRSKNRPLNENTQANSDHPEDLDAENSLSPMETSLQGRECTCELVVPGKRKRSIKSRCEVHGCRWPSESDKTGHCITNGNKMDTEYYSHESSSLSSSETESDTGVVTNDESREADDEQSDFFHEPGPSCGIPGIIPWWESDNTENSHSMETDPTFEEILTGSFRHMSPASQTSFKARVNKLLGTHGREIRAARRKLKDRRPGYTVGRFIQDRQNWRVIQGKHGICWQSVNTTPQSEDSKRRKKTPSTGTPNASVPEGFVGEDADPIPDSNIGNQMLQSMGWVPGTGLGTESEGITIPIIAYRRSRRQGLGCGSRHSSDS